MKPSLKTSVQLILVIAAVAIVIIGCGKSQKPGETSAGVAATNINNSMTVRFASTLLAVDYAPYFVAKKLGRYRRDPAEKLLSVTLIFVREMLPLPAKVIRCCTFITLNFRQISEARHPGVNGKGSGASVTTQSAFDYFQVFDALDRNLKRAIAGRTHEIRE